MSPDEVVAFTLDEMVDLIGADLPGGIVIDARPGELLLQRPDRMRIWVSAATVRAWMLGAHN